MPEGDAVYRTAARLRGALDGRPLTRSDFRVPRHATADLTGRQVITTLSRGKHLLTRIEGDLTVHTHLRMEGSWLVSETGRRIPPGDQVRLILANERWQAVGVRLGMVDLVRTDGEARLVGHLGPDLLGPDWDPDEAVRRLRGRPAGPSGRRCSISATWRGSARSIAPRPCSCAESGRGGGSARSRTSRGSCRWPNGCWRPTRGMRAR
ncbi:DNA-formamidopyrimidine glycosylase family protein [Nonomuraea thailandensis]